MADLVTVVQSYSKHTCGAPSRDRTALVWIIGVVFLALGLVCFGLRVMAKLYLGTQTWGPDDWVMLLAVVRHNSRVQPLKLLLTFPTVYDDTAQRAFHTE